MRNFKVLLFADASDAVCILMVEACSKVIMKSWNVKFCDCEVQICGVRKGW